ncbi:MAG: Ger(x)C family spore germination protein [Clostridia bacterium]|nr:Ger(x)C family spore germination protein [Clostridia bacterium]
MRKVSLLLITLFFFFIMTACTTDGKEIDDQVYALILGLDKGVDNKIRLTIQYPTYKGGGGMQKSEGGGEDKKSGQIDNTVVTTIEASSILEGINLLNTVTSRRISLVHLKKVVFSEYIARQGIKNYLEPLARFREIRRITQIAVCRGSAEDFINENKTLIGESISKSMELMTSQSQNTGYFPKTPFETFYKGILSPYGQAYSTYVGINDFKHLKPLSEATAPLRTEYPILPGEIPRTGDLARETIGTAVFDGDRMVGSLNSYETRYFMMVSGGFEKGIFTLEDRSMPGSAIPFDVRLGRKPKVKVTFNNGVPIIDVNLNIEADIGAIQSRIPYEKLERIDELNDLIADIIQNGIKKTIEKTQKEWNTDIFSFGYQAAKHFFTIQEFEKYNWLRHYKEAKVNVSVQANVRRTGLMTESAPVRYSNQDVLSEEK